MPLLPGLGSFVKAFWNKQDKSGNKCICLY